MTKREAIQQFRDYVLPEIKKEHEKDGLIDLPARRQAWNDYIDALQKNGRITVQQAATWTSPFS